MTRAVFWVSGAVVFYVYIGYPLLLEVLGRTRRGRVVPGAGTQDAQTASSSSAGAQEPSGR